MTCQGHAAHRRQSSHVNPEPPNFLFPTPPQYLMKGPRERPDVGFTIVSEAAPHHLGMGSAAPHPTPSPLTCQGTATPPPLQTTVITEGRGKREKEGRERRRRRTIVTASITGKNFQVPGASRTVYMHQLMKPSQKAPKGSGHYDSHFTGEETEARNGQVRFPASASCRAEEPRPTLRLRAGRSLRQSRKGSAWVGE